jgi:hypothetical protein
MQILPFLNRSSKIQKAPICHKAYTAKGIVVLLLLANTIPCQAQLSTIEPIQDDPYKLTFQTSLATAHFHPTPSQNNHQGLLNLEWNYKDNFLVGAAAFENTFYQSTQVIYWGAKFHPIDSVPDMYFKLVGGLIHGYRGAYADKIPFNDYGTAPVILPAVGYCYKQLCSELIVFGVAGAMLTAGVRF